MKTTPKSRLLLMELVCDLVIFTLCAVVCVALLVQARSMSQTSTELTRAVYLAQEAVETGFTGTTEDGYLVSAAETACTDGPNDRLYTVTREGRVIYELVWEVAP